MPSIRFCVLLLATHAAAALPAHAGINKCVDANGVVSYSDQPCAKQAGQREAEVNDPTGIAQAEARERNRTVGRGCATLTARRSHCYASTDERVAKAFAQLCREPLRQLEHERALARRRAAQQGTYEDERHEEAEESPRGQCNALPTDMWTFVKTHYGHRMTPEEIKAIDYRLGAMPADGRMPDLKVRRR